MTLPFCFSYQNSEILYPSYQKMGSIFSRDAQLDMTFTMLRHRPMSGNSGLLFSCITSVKTKQTRICLNSDMHLVCISQWYKSEIPLILIPELSLQAPILRTSNHKLSFSRNFLTKRTSPLPSPLA